jgi:hypothetical protein
MTLLELAEEISREHRRLVRRMIVLNVLAALSLIGGWLLVALGIGGTGFAWLLALAAVLMVGSWLGSARWRTLLSALGPLLREELSPQDAPALLEIARRLELAPISPGVGPDGSRLWPLTDRQRELSAQLARLLPRLDPDEAASLTPEQRRWLQGTLSRSVGRVDPAFGREFLIAALLTLGAARERPAQGVARALSHHPEVRVRTAATECLAALKRGNG